MPKTSKPEEEPDATDAIEEADDELTPAAPSSRKKGGSGALAAIIAIAVVLILAVMAYTHFQGRREAAQKARDDARSLAASRMGTIQAGVTRASTALEDTPPDVDAAIEALSNAAENTGLAAADVMAADGDLAGQLQALQSDLRSAAAAIQDQYAQYRETVKAAEEDFRTKSNRELDRVSSKLRTQTSAAVGDAETPVVTGAPSVTPETAPPAESTPAPTEAEPPTTGTAPAAAPTPATEPAPQPATR
jgi:uncharacterized phage infection (PIP) family protein YhgE